MINEELEGEGIITDRQLDSSDNEKVMHGHQIAQALSARNQQCQSRQEDLETVYMQSTIQFGKDVNALKIGHISKSPDPILVGAGKDHS